MAENTWTYLKNEPGKTSAVVVAFWKDGGSSTRIPFDMTLESVLLMTGREGRADDRVLCFAFCNGREVGENHVLLYQTFVLS